MPLVVICNPTCGAGDGYSFVRDHVLPVLNDAEKIVDNLFITERAGHAGELVVELLKASSSSEQITVILSSGDGTLHEIVNEVYFSVSGDLKSIPPLTFALVPSGTANALFSSLFPGDGLEASDSVGNRMKGIHRFLQEGPVAPCTLAKTIIQDAHATQPVREALSVVVTSTALHASILHDSEALRATVPDMSRFKLAAAKNIQRWYYGSAKLLPLETGEILRFDSDRRGFVSESGDTEFKGPFTYFLSTVNVDRLEPQFRITPLQNLKHSNVIDYLSMDVMILRPMRDGSVEDDDKGHTNTVEATTRVLSGAYQDGTHLDLRFSGENSKDKYIAEYFRCGGWQWTPDKSDGYAHLLCSDGNIFQIPREGRAICNVLTREERKFLVYAGH